ncbi:MAG: double-strand break repair protein AddB, partial [Methylobacteriaceae bacterium]|nr:double-strand break repair protein AddB [Methylobacteriaceae bacterium]
MLPRIAPLGALDEETPLWPRDVEDEDADVDPAIPPAIGDVARRLRLTRLTLAWARALQGAILWADGAGPRVDEGEANLVATTPAAALGLAGDLAALIDEMIIEGIDWSRLDGLAAGDLDRYWAITLDFLKIARDAWPQILREQGLVDGAARRAALIARETARLRAGRAGPVIAVGSTGTNAATQRLLAAIAAAPQGAVVLPGLDVALDDASWNMIGAPETSGLTPAAGHPQAALKRLLEALGVERKQVAALARAPAALARRAAFLSDAMRPADSTHLWREAKQRPGEGDIAHGLAGVALVEAADEREEAQAAAVALREALETPERRAALVTPDRRLARRVQEELRRWSVETEESGGTALSRTPAGALARLVVETVADGCPAGRLAALLAHADLRLGFDAARFDAARTDLDAAVLRGATAPDALADMPALLAAARAAAQERRAHRAARALDAARWRDVETAMTRLSQALAPLRDLSRATLDVWLAAHRRALAALTEGAAEQPAAPRRDRLALDELMDAVAAAHDPALDFDVADYAAFLARLLDAETLAPDEAGHPRLQILGALEARLVDVDLVVLGGLDETIWPPAVTTDAFLNRPMRAAVGLSPPER